MPEYKYYIGYAAYFEVFPYNTRNIKFKIVREEDSFIYRRQRKRRDYRL